MKAKDNISRRSEKGRTLTKVYMGKRLKVRGETAEERQRKMADKIAQIDNGACEYNESVTFKEWSSYWLKLKENKLQSSTFKDHKSRLQNYIYPVLGDTPIRYIKLHHLQEIIDAAYDGSECDGKRLKSKDRLNKLKQTLKLILMSAYENEIISKVPPFRSIELPKNATDKLRRCITDSELSYTITAANKIIASGEGVHTAYWILSIMLCGFRPQETAALKGCHIDIQGNVINIKEALKRDQTIGPPKSAAGVRQVYIPPLLRDFFEGAAKNSSEFVFRSKNGCALNNNNMGTMWKAFKKEMNIAAGCKVEKRKDGNAKLYDKIVSPLKIANDLVPYCYRHTFVTCSIYADVDMDSISKLVGHKDIATTCKYYAHMTKDRIDKAGDKQTRYWEEKIDERLIK